MPTAEEEQGCLPGPLGLETESRGASWLLTTLGQNYFRNEYVKVKTMNAVIYNPTLLYKKCMKNNSINAYELK